MKPAFVVALSLLVALLTSCIGQRTPDEPGVATWTGEVSLHSSSVPDPYNWSRTAELSGTGVALTVYYSPTTEPGPQDKKEWTNQLGEPEAAEVDAIVRSFGPEPTAPILSGACLIHVSLTSDRGDKVELTASQGDSNYAKALALWPLLAGPDDIEFPEHSFKC